MALAAIFGTVSCNKNFPAQSSAPEEAVPDAAISINIGMENRGTKATTDEVKAFQINSAQVFVFDSENKLETSYYEQGLSKNTTHSMKIATFTGQKTVYVIVNHSRLNKFKPHTSTISDLENQITDLYTNKPSSLVMSGKNEVTVVKYGNNGTAGSEAQIKEVNVYVKRLAAMIQLDGIQVDFRGTHLEGATFTVQQIYLKNVVGKCKLGVSGLTASAQSDVHPLPLDDDMHTDYNYWYNKGTLQSTGVPPTTMENMSEPCNVAGVTTTLGRHLFAFPNKTVGDSHANPFDQRHTRLVIKAHVKAAATYSDLDTDTYYVFDLPVLAANNIYRVKSLRITMLGKDNDNNDDDVQAGRISPVITVDEWNGTTDLTYDF